jgi:hypothetical protein
MCETWKGLQVAQLHVTSLDDYNDDDPKTHTNAVGKDE